MWLVGSWKFNCFFSILGIILNEKRQNESEIVYNNNENKIINLGKFFNNKRKGERVFSIYEPIKYEDLEKLAVDVIQLNDDDTKYFNNLAK